MVHALLDPGYLARVRESVVRGVEGREGVRFCDLREWDSIRHAGVPVLVVDIDHGFGQMVVMDSRDRCEVLSDCAGERWHRVGF